jgi:hypothetical protein
MIVIAADVVGVVKHTEDLREVANTKDRRKLYGQRIVCLTDENLRLIQLTLWGEHAERELKLMDILVLKSVEVTEYEGRILLSSARSSTVHVS